MSANDEIGKSRPFIEGFATEETLQAVAGLVDVPYDTVEVNYTDATKEVIDTVVYKLTGVTVKTITATNPTVVKEIYTIL